MGLGAAVTATGLLMPSLALAFERETLVESGPAENRVNLFVLGDGYTQAEAAVLRDKAVRISDQLRALPFLVPYQGFINTHVIYSTSDCSGARNGDNPPTCTTVFDSYYDCYGAERLICVGDEDRVNATLAADAPEYLLGRDIALVSVNDTRSGGSGGVYPVVSDNENSVRVAMHEMGHSFAGLGDEYETGGGPGCGDMDCPEPNVTRFYERDVLKWSPWIEPNTPLPTPATTDYTDVVGAFLGAMYSSDGAYRPKQDCRMRSNFAPFCEVCAEAWIWQLWASVRRIESFSPTSQTLSLVRGTSQVFEYSGPKTSPNTLTQVWRLDGVEVSSLESYTLSTCSTTVGSHALTLENTDTTTLVRRDPDGLRTETVAWDITVTQDPADACHGGDGGATGAGGGTADAGGAPSDGNGGVSGAASGGDQGSGGTWSGGASSGGHGGISGAASGGDQGSGGTSSAGEPGAGGQANGGEPGSGGRPSTGGSSAGSGTEAGGEPVGNAAGSSTKPVSEQAGATDVTAGSANADDRSAPSNDQGCGCRLPRHSSHRSKLAALMLAGLFAGLGWRRRAQPVSVPPTLADS